MSEVKERLKNVRVKISMREDIAPYSVFDDELLEILVEKHPRTITELSQIKGFPQTGARVTKWGEEIVNSIKGLPVESKLKSF